MGGWGEGESPARSPCAPSPGLPIPLSPHLVRATPSGRDALRRILAYLRPRPDDEIWISTTLGMTGRHVSPCVTATIAHYCRFAFAPGPRTTAALVIHDYGVPHPQLREIVERCRHQGWALIEDAAHAFASRDDAGRPMGEAADFALFSLPKFFSLPNGGLVAGLPAGVAGDDDAAVCERLHVQLAHVAAIAAARRRNWHALDRALAAAGLATSLPLTPGSVPSLYVLVTERQFATVRRLRAAGIESGPDLHCRRALLPCHQGVQPEHIERIVQVVLDAHGADARAVATVPAPSPWLRLTPGRANG